MPRERSSHRTLSRVTTNHDEVRKWVESRGGFPAAVKKTRGTDEPGIVRIDFPGFKGGESLERISWEDFFEQFDRRGLAFLYQEKTASGRVSRFNKIISRETAEGAEQAVKRLKKAA